MWRGGLGAADLLPALSSAGASIAARCFRFHIPLIEPDGPVSGIRLSEKGSRGCPRETARPLGKAGKGPALRAGIPSETAWSPATILCAWHTTTDAASDCYRVERTSSRTGYSRCGPAPFTAHPITALSDIWVLAATHRDSRVPDTFQLVALVALSG